jgi:hypothetical protein
MKVIYLLFVILFSGFIASSQNNDIVVYSLESEPFYVVLNGVRQNENPETNVRIENVNGDFHRLRVIFANKEFGSVDQSINFFEKDTEIKIEMVFKRNKFRARFMGENKKDKSKAQDEKVITYHDEEKKETNKTESQTIKTSESKESSAETSVRIDVSERGIKTEVSHKESYQAKPEDAIGDIEIIEGETEEVYQFMPNGSMCNRPSVTQEDYMKFRFAIDEENMFKRQEFIINFFSENCMTSAQVAGIVQLDYSTIKPYEIAKQGYRYTWDTENYDLVVASLKSENDRKKLINFLDIGVEGSEIEKPRIDQGTGSVAVEEVEISNSSLVEGYSGGVNCNFGEFVDANELKNTADKENFSADKMQIIRLKSQNKCFTVDDLKVIVETFTHESDKMDFLELAFHNTYDAGSFYQLLDVLTHSASKEKLGNYIKGQTGSRYGNVVDKNNQMAVATYSGEVGSVLPIISQEGFMNTLSNQVFQKDKMAVIDLALANYSLTTDQFIEVAKAAFTSEKDILEFVRKAKSNIYDIDNFHKVREIFSFNSSKNEFDEILGL